MTSSGEYTGNDPAVSSYPPPPTPDPQSPPTSLYTSTDDAALENGDLSPAHHTLRKDLISLTYEQLDARSNSPLRLVVQCKHCQAPAIAPTSLSAQFFYAKIVRFAKTHADQCSALPRAIKDRYKRQNKDNKRGRKQYWGYSANRIGLVDVERRGGKWTPSESSRYVAYDPERAMAALENPGGLVVSEPKTKRKRRPSQKVEQEDWDFSTEEGASTEEEASSEEEEEEEEIDSDYESELKSEAEPIVVRCKVTESSSGVVLGEVIDPSNEESGSSPNSDSTSLRIQIPKSQSTSQSAESPKRKYVKKASYWEDRRSPDGKEKKRDYKKDDGSPRRKYQKKSAYWEERFGHPSDDSDQDKPLDSNGGNSSQDELAEDVRHKHDTGPPRKVESINVSTQARLLLFSNESEAASRLGLDFDEIRWVCNSGGGFVGRHCLRYPSEDPAGEGAATDKLSPKASKAPTEEQVRQYINDCRKQSDERAAGEMSLEDQEMKEVPEDISIPPFMRRPTTVPAESTLTAAAAKPTTSRSNAPSQRHIPGTTNTPKKVEVRHIEPNNERLPSFLRVRLFESVSAAAKKMGVNRSVMSRICLAGGGRIGFFHCSYANQEDEVIPLNNVDERAVRAGLDSAPANSATDASAPLSLPAPVENVEQQQASQDTEMQYPITEATYEVAADAILAQVARQPRHDGIAEEKKDGHDDTEDSTKRRLMRYQLVQRMKRAATIGMTPAVFQRRFLAQIRANENEAGSVRARVSGRVENECTGKWSEEKTAKNTNTIGKGWTEDEYARLVEGVKRFGNDYVKVSKFVGTRTNVQCRNKADTSKLEIERVKGKLKGKLKGKKAKKKLAPAPVLNNRPFNKGKWTDEELALLHEAIDQYPEGSIDWGHVSNHVNTRSLKQCRCKYHDDKRSCNKNVPADNDEGIAKDPYREYETENSDTESSEDDANASMAISKHSAEVVSRKEMTTLAEAPPFNKCGRWSKEEESRLVEAIERHGRGNWTTISKHVKTRSALQCKSKDEKDEIKRSGDGTPKNEEEKRIAEINRLLHG